MNIITRWGRTLLLSAVMLVGAVTTVWLSGCSDESMGEAVEDRSGDGGGGNNIIGNNNCTSAEKCKSKSMPDGKTWMTENLNIATDNSWCYDGKDENCGKYGRLYTWKAAMDGSSSSTLNPSGVKGVCPTGWHLPSRQEWNVLMTAVGGSSTAGKKLKSQTGWNDYNGQSGNGTDDYGFSALPGGDRISVGAFGRAGDFGVWWTATEHSESNAYRRNMDYNYDYVDEDSYDKSNGFSVRCVQD